MVDGEETSEDQQVQKVVNSSQGIHGVDRNGRRRWAEKSSAAFYGLADLRCGYSLTHAPTCRLNMHALSELTAASAPIHPSPTVTSAASWRLGHHSGTWAGSWQRPYQSSTTFPAARKLDTVPCSPTQGTYLYSTSEDTGGCAAAASALVGYGCRAWPSLASAGAGYLIRERATNTRLTGTLLGGSSL